MSDNRTKDSMTPCIHRSGCPKPDVCQQVGHCTSMTTAPHASDCATNNAPALPVGPCDCGAITSKKLTPEIEAGIRLRHSTVEQSALPIETAGKMAYLSHLDRRDLLEEVERLTRERDAGTAALRAAFGEDLWALGHPAYVVVHLRQEYAKAERLWKEAAIERDRLRALLRDSRNSIKKAADADCVCVDGPQQCKYCRPHRALLERIDAALSVEPPSPVETSPSLAQIREEYHRFGAFSARFVEWMGSGVETTCNCGSKDGLHEFGCAYRRAGDTGHAVKASGVYTNEAPAHPPILPERFNSVSQPLTVHATPSTGQGNTSWGSPVKASGSRCPGHAQLTGGAEYRCKLEANHPGSCDFK